MTIAQEFFVGLNNNRWCIYSCLGIGRTLREAGVDARATCRERFQGHAKFIGEKGQPELLSDASYWGQLVGLVNAEQ